MCGLTVRGRAWDFLGLRSGEILAMLAVLVWLMTCVMEAKATVYHSYATWSSVLQHPNRATVRQSRARQCSQARMSFVGGHIRTHLYAVDISKYRAVGITLLITIPRLILTLLLCTVGILFLVGTAEIEELILNAVALEVVLRTDELFHKVGDNIVSARAPWTVSRG